LVIAAWLRCLLEVEQRDGVAPEPVLAAVDHVDGVARYHQGGVADLEDPAWIGEVQALGIPQLGGDPSDLPAATSLRQLTAHHQRGARLKELGQGLGVVDHEGVLQQGLQLLRRSRSRAHDDA
jgi:hypothetical protein